jgi:hypothetical protein
MKKITNYRRLWTLGAMCGFVCAALLRAQAGEPTAFQLIKEGDRFVGEQSKDKVLAIYSDKSLTGLTPSIWYVDYYDPDAKYKIIEVKFGAGLKLDVKRPWRPFGGSGSEDRKFDLATFKVDSDAAIGIATSQQLLKPLTLQATQLWLRRSHDGLVWKVRLWAAKLSDPKVSFEIGDVYISPVDGNVVRADLHIERAK